MTLISAELQAGLQDYVDRLAENADYQALYEMILEDCANLLVRLVILPFGTPPAEVEALRGEIRGMLRLVTAEDVARRAIKERRER